VIDKNVYPLSARLEKFILKEIAQVEAEHPFASYETTSVVVKIMLNNFREYEHGTVDVTDLFDPILGLYRITDDEALRGLLSVYEDVILTLIWGR
jgi:hypothetical protein